MLDDSPGIKGIKVGWAQCAPAGPMHAMHARAYLEYLHAVLSLRIPQQPCLGLLLLDCKGTSRELRLVAHSRAASAAGADAPAPCAASGAAAHHNWAALGPIQRFARCLLI